MKSKIAFLAPVMIVAFALSFWLYGAARTMQETIGFNGKVFLFGLLFGFVLPLSLILSLLIARTFLISLKTWTPPSFFVAIGVAFLIGSFLSEWWIQYDERKFSSEISKAALDGPYSRARAWPNSTCGLVFEPGQGIHATD